MTSKPPAVPAKTLVLGLGNPYLSDDRVGLLVAERTRAALAPAPHVQVRDASVAGFDLLELLSGFDRAIIVDSIQTPGGEPGTVHRLCPADVTTTERLGTSHEIDLPCALALGDTLGIPLPKQVVIYAVEIVDNRRLGQTLTGPVAQAVEKTTALVIDEVNRPGI